MKFSVLLRSSFQAVFGDSVSDGSTTAVALYHCSPPAWSKLEPVHPDFACLALNFDISVFYQFWMLVLEA